jgi:hypothetical protein
MGAQAASELRQRHPNPPDEAVRVLEMCYTFDWK